jgi:hypothetical protein
MSMTVQIDLTLVESQCGECGVWFGFDERFYNARRNDHRSWYCPNGHRRAFLGETEAQRLQRLLNSERDHRASVAAERDQYAASLRTTTGHVTRLRKRATAGACPFGCRRHFVNLERHVATKHPDALLDGES